MSAAFAGNRESRIPSGSSTRRVAASAKGWPVMSAISWPSTQIPPLLGEMTPRRPLQEITGPISSASSGTLSA